MTFEEILACLIFYSRFIIIAVAVIIPILLSLLLINSIFKKKYKRSLILILGILFSIAFVYLVFFDFQIAARIDVNSIVENKTELLSLKSGEYEFDAGYIVGEMYVYDESEIDFYKPTIEVSEVYDVDDITCSVSSLICCKDARFSYAFFPTISSGELLLEHDKKIIEVYYYYNNSNNPICCITNPQIFYREKIDFADILQTYTDQSD